MSKVQVIVNGRVALVPVKYAQKVQRKQQLVAEATALRACANEMVAADYNSQMAKIVSKIIQLNRQIPPVVEFVRS